MTGLQNDEQVSTGAIDPSRRSLEVKICQTLGSRSTPPAALQVLIGITAAVAAVRIRYLVPLSPMQLPVLAVVVAVALTSTFTGPLAGITTAVLGGLLSWYIFFEPFAWDLSRDGAIPMLGFFVTSLVIVTTTHLYRRSEQRNYEAQFLAVRKQADDAELFAREMAHRLKNALAIVQSIAFQTLGHDTDAPTKFAARLKALADTHDLLNEHVSRPSASVGDVIDAALKPFRGHEQRIHVDCSDTVVSAQQAVSLALILHELGTNASKYGALSRQNGNVALQVREVGDQILLRWSERGGPQVSPPVGAGFGTKLLRRIGSGAELCYDPDGFRCALSLRKH